MYSAIVAATTFAISSIAKANAMKKTAKETYDYKDRLLTEAVEQKKDQRDLFDSQVSGRYGSDFLSKLRDGASSDTLIQSISQETAIGKQLADYGNQARLAIENAQTTMTQQGSEAAAAGQANALDLHGMDIQTSQAEAQAVAAQAASGVRSTGSGDNLRKMQILDNEIALEKARYQIDSANTRVMHALVNTRTSANQKADALRVEKDIKAKSVLESALSDFATHATNDGDAQRGIDNLTTERTYWEQEKQKSGWDLFWGN
jgi:hypothetical protein